MDLIGLPRRRGSWKLRQNLTRRYVLNVRVPFRVRGCRTEWGSEKRTSPGVGTRGSARKPTPVGGNSVANTPQDYAVSPASAAQLAPEPAKEAPHINETPELSQVVAAALSAESEPNSPAPGLEVPSISPEIDVKPTKQPRRHRHISRTRTMHSR